MTFEQGQRQTDKAIERLAGKHQKAITREYAKALKEIRSKLAVAYEKHAVGKELTYAEMSKYNRLANLEKDIFDEINKLTGKNATKLKHGLGEVYQESYQRTAFNVEKEVQAKLAFGKLDPKTVEAAVENPLDKVGFLKRNRSNQDRLKDQLSSELTQGLIKGESYQDVARRLKKRMDVGATNMDRIAQTEMHRCHMQGKRKSLDHAESKGVEMRYRWVATLDQRTRDTHQEYDGMLTVTDDDGKQMFDLPGIGLVEGPGMTGIAEEDINCRCAMIGVIEGYEPKVRRSREEGKIPYQTYKEYAKDKGWDVKWDGPEPRVKEAPEEKLPKALSEVEGEIAKRKTSEKGYVLTPEGDIIGSQVGGKDYIEFTDELSSNFRGNILTHNHPKGTSLSRTDVLLAEKHGMHEIRAATEEHVFSLRPPAEGWKSKYYTGRKSPISGIDEQLELKEIIHEVDNAVRAEFTGAIQRGEMTPEYANKNHTHELWSRVSEKTGIIYTKEER